MLPRTLCQLSTRAAGEIFVPHYLTERDHPWLRALLTEHARFVGRRRSELRERLREPLPVYAPKAKLRVASHVLEVLGRAKVSSAVPPRKARHAVFRAASRTRALRETVLADVARELRVEPAALDASLYADLAGERRVMPLAEPLSPPDFAVEANLAIVTGLLRRAARLRIQAWGNTRALVRQARLSGLICTLSRAGSAPAEPSRPTGAAELDVLGPTQPGVMLDVSGPFALFRHTEIYGRALAALVPRAAWCHAFEISAECALGRGSELSRVLVGSGDPIGVGRELAQHDSRLEQRFAADFGRAAPDWDLVREPSPVESEGSLIFPDFEIVHRREQGRRWLLEIVGFWTPEYLEEKLRRLRAAGLDRLIVCVDETRACQDEELPEHAKVVRFRRRIDPEAVLAVLEGR